MPTRTNKTSLRTGTTSKEPNTPTPNYGVCFEISDNTDLFPFGELTEEKLIASDFHINSADNVGGDFEDAYVFELELFVDKLNASQHVLVLPDKNEDELTLTFSKPFKLEHFASRFDLLKKYVRNMSYDDFSNDDLIP